MKYLMYVLLFLYSNTLLSMLEYQELVRKFPNNVCQELIKEWPPIVQEVHAHYVKTNDASSDFSADLKNLCRIWHKLTKENNRLDMPYSEVSGKSIAKALTFYMQQFTEKRKLSPQTVHHLNYFFYIGSQNSKQASHISLDFEQEEANKIKIINMFPPTHGFKSMCLQLSTQHFHVQNLYQILYGIKQNHFYLEVNKDIQQIINDRNDFYIYKQLCSFDNDLQEHTSTIRNSLRLILKEFNISPQTSFKISSDFFNVCRAEQLKYNNCTMHNSEQEKANIELLVDYLPNSLEELYRTRPEKRPNMATLLENIYGALNRSEYNLYLFHDVDWLQCCTSRELFYNIFIGTQLQKKELQEREKFYGKLAKLILTAPFADKIVYENSTAEAINNFFQTL